MHISFDAAISILAGVLEKAGVVSCEDMAWATVWLEACGYPGLQMLAEALEDERRSVPPDRDLIGFDMQNVSCAFMAPAIIADVSANGRVFLRNVRHGLFLLPFTVRENMAIGCPVDPSFAVGGERSKNPYDEKLAHAAAHGLTLDDGLWQAVTGR
jgi:hypothetical protein